MSCSTCNTITYSSVGPKGDRGLTGNTGATGASGSVPGVIDAATATKTLDGTTDSGSIILLNRSAGVDTILPTAPVDGTNYTFQPIVDPTTGSYVITTGGTDIISGYVYSNKSGALPVLYTATAGTETSITLNGSTSGGLIGTSIDMIYSAGTWYTSGTNFGSGATITPFA